MKRTVSRLLALFVTAFLLLAVTGRAAYIYRPARFSYGSTWGMFLSEEKDSADIMFFGSSLAYCDVIPAVIRENTGKSSYVMAGPSQVIPATYYYIREALKTQSPKVVFVEATGMFYPEYTEFSNVNVGYMPYSMNRIAAAFASAPKEERTGLIFPMFNYHQEWVNFSPADYFTPKADEKQDILAGYTYLTEIKPQNVRTERAEFSQIDEKVFARNLKYLKKIGDFCEKNGVAVQLFISPAVNYVPKEAIERLKTEVDNIEGLRFVDFNEDFDDIGLSLESDFFDKLHLNFNGALKFSKYLSDFIDENYPFESSAGNAELWEERIEYIKSLQKADS